MTLTFRPDMKAIVHEVDGRPASVVGHTLGSDAHGLLAVVEVFDDTDLRIGAEVRCSYVEPSGVHTFDSVLVGADPLTLNHRKVRISIAAPTSAQRVQRREHVRVPVELPADVHRLSDDTTTGCTAIDLSAGGMAVAWPGEVAPEIGEEIRVVFRTERFDHDHRAIVLGANMLGKRLAVRAQFTELSDAERNRLTTAVFALQRALLQRQRGAPGPP